MPIWDRFKIMFSSLKKWDKKLADSAWEWAKHLAQNRKFETGKKN
jgi:hypothetical protein